MDLFVGILLLVWLVAMPVGLVKIKRSIDRVENRLHGTLPPLENLDSRGDS